MEKSSEIKRLRNEIADGSVQRTGQGVVRELAYAFGECGAKPMNRIDAYRMCAGVRSRQSFRVGGQLTVQFDGRPRDRR